MTGVSYVVPPNYASVQNPNDHNRLTTGAYGNAFELALDTATNSDGTTSDTLTYKDYTSDKTGSFSATAETGTGSSLNGAYSSLLASMQADGNAMDGASAAKLQDAMSELGEKSQSGTTDAAVSGGDTGGAGVGTSLF